MPVQPGLLQVVDVVDPLPGLRRITFSGERLAAFPSECAAGHIKLFFPTDPRDVPELPYLDAEGNKRWPIRRPVTRTYSVRAFDPRTRRLSVEFVLHDAPGPASDWARVARPGLRIGVAGPAVPAVLASNPNWNLFVGDLSALPMISALVERLPLGAVAEVLLELPTDRTIHFDAECRVQVTQRLGSRGEALLPMLKDVVFPKTRTSLRVCAAGESAVIVSLRHYLERELRLPKSALYTVPYWKHAATEEEYHQERHVQLDAMEAP